MEYNFLIDCHCHLEILTECNRRLQNAELKMSEIHIYDQVSSNPVPRVKPLPKDSSIPLPFFYAPSDDGVDENLLILLHGLGEC